MSDADELVELIVPARERSCVARALLAAAEQLGLPAEVVRSTSTGYRVPRAVADAADVELARAEGDDPLPGTQVYATHPPGGRVTYARAAAPGEQPDDEADGAGHQVAEADELPEPVRNRRKAGGRS